MTDLTPTQLAAAHDGDADAERAVITAMRPMVSYMARHYNGQHNAELQHDLVQVGLVAVWECIQQYNGCGVPSYIGYARQHISGAMTRERAEQHCDGVSADARLRFEQCMRAADGDARRAAELAVGTSVLGAKHRMTPDAARAALMAHYGTRSMDAPLAPHRTDVEGEPKTLACILADRSAPTTETHTARRAETRRRVRHILSLLNARQRLLICAMTGYGDMPVYGPVVPGAETHDAELAADYGIPHKVIAVARNRAIARFQALWEFHYGMGSLADRRAA